MEWSCAFDAFSRFSFQVDDRASSIIVFNIDWFALSFWFCSRAIFSSSARCRNTTHTHVSKTACPSVSYMGHMVSVHHHTYLNTSLVTEIHVGIPCKPRRKHGERQKRRKVLLRKDGSSSDIAKTSFPRSHGLMRAVCRAEQANHACNWMMRHVTMKRNWREDHQRGTKGREDKWPMYCIVEMLRYTFRTGETWRVMGSSRTSASRKRKPNTSASRKHVSLSIP